VIVRHCDRCPATSHPGDLGQVFAVDITAKVQAPEVPVVAYKPDLCETCIGQLRELLITFVVSRRAK
jgi:hypothetical protein